MTVAHQSYQYHPYPVILVHGFSQVLFEPTAQGTLNETPSTLLQMNYK